MEYGRVRSPLSGDLGLACQFHVNCYFFLTVSGGIWALVLESDKIIKMYPKTQEKACLPNTYPLPCPSTTRPLVHPPTVLYPFAFTRPLLSKYKSIPGIQYTPFRKFRKHINVVQFGLYVTSERSKSEAKRMHSL